MKLLLKIYKSLSIWIPTSYLSPLILFGRSYLLSSSNPTFDPRGEIVQNVKFLLVSQNSDLISKLDLTHQHKFRGMLGFQNRPRIVSY